MVVVNYMLNKYDNKKIKLETIYGDTFEGIGYFYSREYNEHEYGVDEDSIVMSHIMTYESQIKNIEEIDGFSTDYGRLEEIVIEDGVDIIDEVFESDDDIYIYRLLLCIEDNISTFTNKDDLSKELKYLLMYNKDKKVIKKCVEIMKKLIL